MKINNTFAKLVNADNYVAGILGEIWNLSTNRILTPSYTGWTKYMQVGITHNNGERKCKTVHRMVYEAFNGVLDKEMVINHIDEDKTNNSLSNLESMTRADNIRYGTRAQRAVESRKNGTSLRKQAIENRKKRCS